MRISGSIRDQLTSKFEVLFPHLDERQQPSEVDPGLRPALLALVEPE
ncbi:hypothetical protein ACF08N_37115 [Streptomyces sp. NPDC015127]